MYLLCLFLSRILHVMDVFPIILVSITLLCSHLTDHISLIYQSSKFSFSCFSLVESVSREIDEIRMFSSHRRARETMHYSPVNNKKITCAITGTRNLWTGENRECFVNNIVYRIKFNVFWKINKIFHVFSYEVRFIFSFL